MQEQYDQIDFIQLVKELIEQFNIPDQEFEELYTFLSGIYILGKGHSAVDISNTCEVELGDAFIACGLAKELKTNEPLN